MEETNERLDNIIHRFTNRMDWRIYSLPRCWRADSLVALIRPDLVDFAFCDGQARHLAWPVDGIALVNVIKNRGTVP